MKKINLKQIIKKCILENSDTSEGIYLKENRSHLQSISLKLSKLITNHLFENSENDFQRLNKSIAKLLKGFPPIKYADITIDNVFFYIQQSEKFNVGGGTRMLNGELNIWLFLYTPDINFFKNPRNKNKFYSSLQSVVSHELEHVKQHTKKQIDLNNPPEMSGSRDPEQIANYLLTSFEKDAVIREILQKVRKNFSQENVESMLKQTILDFFGFSEKKDLTDVEKSYYIRVLNSYRATIMDLINKTNKPN